MIVIFDDLLTKEEVEELRALAADAKFIDGKKTAGFRARRVKKNQQISWSQESAAIVQNRVLAAIDRHKRLNRICFPKRITKPLVSRSGPGMGYGFHVDDAQIGATGDKNRSDISMTVFLSDPDDYEGGELEIITPYGVAAHKLPAGQAISYPSRFLHQVRTVESGERLVAVCWMESHIRNEQDREILLELDQVNSKLHQMAPDAPETDLGFKVFANLARRWIE